jgi:RNA polymerase sigma factor (sigma-70 family)
VSATREDGKEGRRSLVGKAPRRAASDAARKRVAVAMIARHEDALRRTARRYSLCEDDADDAYQRSLEILLTKAPSDDLRQLIRWTQTVVKHEALTVRRNRERVLSGPAGNVEQNLDRDWVALIPAGDGDPAELAERSEAIARSREALRLLKPQELRALTLLAAGYSYAEIGRMTGYSQTKINRCLAEGRERFRRMLVGGEDGSRCAEMRPLLSTFCDGELSEQAAAALREHLRACAGCRSAMRAYRAAPGAAAALAPALPASHSLLQRVHELFAGLHSRLPGQGVAADAGMAQMAAAGGTRGAGMAALAKALAICVGTAGGAVACVATGVAPSPIDFGADQAARPTLERPTKRVTDSLSSTSSEISYEPTPPEAAPTPQEKAPDPAPATAPTPASPTAGGVEFTPDPAPAPTPAPTEESGSTSGSAAGEFGP